jgi:hypothetical protein
MRRLLRPLWFLLALIFLFEAWLWSWLEVIVARIVRLLALPAVRIWLAAAIEKLPPAATLVVFLIPILLLLPIKLLGFWMLAHGSWLGAMATLALAKVVSMGVTAFIFDVTRPKLLQMAWFRWLYELMLVWLAKAHAITDPIRHRIKEWLAALRQRARRWFWLMKPGRRSRLMRRLARIRRRVQTQPAE